MKYLAALGFLTGFFTLTACDQLPQKNSPGEIIVIGNGILNLNESDGVIADATTSDGQGLVSLIVSPSKTEHLVRDRATNKSIPTYYNWATSGEKKDPVLSLDIKEVEKKCRYFESLQNGDLVCRRDLESLDISPLSPPQFTREGEVFFLDSKNQLLRLWQGRLEVLSTHVYRFAVDKDSNLLFWRMQVGSKSTHHLWRRGAEITFRNEGNNNDIEFVIGKDGVIYPLYINSDPAHAAGLYRWVWTKENPHPTETLIQAWPMDWLYQNRTVDPDSKMLVVGVTKTDSTQALVEVSELGMRLLEDKTLEEKPALELPVQPTPQTDSEVQKLGDAFVSKNRKEETFSYCRSDSLHPELPTRCESIVADNAKVLDVILKSELDVYALAIEGELRKIDHYHWDENTQKLVKLATRDLQDPIVRFRTPTEKLSSEVESSESKLVTGE